MGVAFEYDARAVVTEDIDLDGRKDLLVVEHKAEGLDKTYYRLHVYRNVFQEAQNWVGVQLIDEKGASTIGATIEITTVDGKQFDRIVTGDSFSSQHSANVHFGLGELNEVKSLKITWANGRQKTIKKPEAGKYHKISAS